MRIRQVINRGMMSSMLVLAASMYSTAQAQLVEDDRYLLRVMTDIFDGAEAFSHSQTIGFARSRKDDQSYIQIDYKDGALVKESPYQTAATSFQNTSSPEADFLYDYATHTLSGSNTVGDYFNAFISPLMANNQPLGEDATWSKDIAVSDLGTEGIFEGEFTIEVSRDYFTHNDKDLVVVTYDIPAFSYESATGLPVVHWARGAALLDANMAELYWNTTLHQAVLGDGIQDAQPYRYAKTIAMMTHDEIPVVNIERIPEAWRVFNALHYETSDEVLPFSTNAISDSSPIKMAMNLDLLGLSLAENSGNQAPLLSGQQTSGSHGNQKSNPPTNPTISATTETAGVLNDILNTYTSRGVAVTKAASNSLDIYREISTIVAEDAGALNLIAADMERLNRQLDANSRAFSNLNQAYIDTTQDFVEELKNGQKFETIVPLSVQRTYDQMSVLNEEFEGIQRLLDNNLAEPSDLVRLGQIEQEFLAASKLYDQGVANIKPVLVLSDKAKELQQRLAWIDKTMAERAVISEKLAKEVLIYEGLQRRMPVQVVGKIKEKIGILPIDKLSSNAKALLRGADVGLTGLSHLNNANTVRVSFVNFVQAAANDQSSGDLSLTRNYGDGAVTDLALDLTGLVANALSGDVSGTFSDGAAILGGSLSDLYVSAKGLKDINARNAELAKMNAEMQRTLTAMKAQKSDRETLLFEVSKLIAASDLSEAEKDRLFAELENINVMQDGDFERLTALGTYARDNTSTQTEQDAYDAQARENLERQRKYRAELRQQREAQEEARIEGLANIKAENERRRKANEGFQDAVNDRDYPVTDPNDVPKPPAEFEDPFGDLDSTETISTVEDILTDPTLQNVWVDPYTDFDLDEYQRLAMEQRTKDREAWLESLRKDPKGDLIGANVRQYEENGVTHYVFTSVDWNAPTFDMPDWVPPTIDPVTFSGVDFSGFGWSTFDEDDGLPRGFSNLAVDYDGLSGTVKTDTSDWDEWIDRVGRRQLERLAKQAGYPNLASALNDWQNLFKNANDPDWVRWAMNAPSCAGYGGCGPQYQGRWTMKLSQLELGRLISDSRDVFSSAGLSDIAIFGFDLSYVLRDFGLEDGDLVEVVVSQFGRELLRREVSLLNAGTDFNIRLNPGVASVEITALNEGAISPNTAEVTINNVAEGDGEQQYSLLTGGQATLRVESGR